MRDPSWSRSTSCRRSVRILVSHRVLYQKTLRALDHRYKYLGQSLQLRPQKIHLVPAQANRVSIQLSTSRSQPQAPEPDSIMIVSQIGSAFLWYIMTDQCTQSPKQILAGLSLLVLSAWVSAASCGNEGSNRFANADRDWST